MTDADIIVIGAGPVGMLSVLMAQREGFSCILLEQKPARDPNPRAVGISPPTLEIMRRLDLDLELVKRGVPVTNSWAGGAILPMGRADFSCFKSDYKFILSIPQNYTESLLEETLEKMLNVRFLRGHKASDIKEKGSIVEISGLELSGKNFNYRSRYAIACDGSKSAMRTSLGINFKGAPYRETFLMGDFEDNSGWKNEGRLFMTKRGSVESFPLPGGRRRYVLRTPYFIKEYTTDFLEMEIPKRCGVNIDKAVKFWESGFGVQRFIAESFYKGRIILCGDAAHVMSPIGGQNMNIGFADAEMAVWLIRKSDTLNQDYRRLFKIYDKIRKRAAMSASFRAGFLMKFGTSGGVIWNAVRYLISFVIINSPLKKMLVPMLGMMTIPYRNLDSCRERIERLCGL